MLLIRLLLLPVTLVLLVVRLAYRTIRLLGVRRLVVFGAGVGAGLAAAPGPGAELRAKVRDRIEGRSPPSDGELAERVRAELSRSPRTWHLPQPAVEVVSGTAVLRGTVPHDDGRTDLERATAAVPGIVAVDNHLAVAAAT